MIVFILVEIENAVYFLKMQFENVLILSNKITQYINFLSLYRSFVIFFKKRYHLYLSIIVDRI